MSEQTHQCVNQPSNVQILQDSNYFDKAGSWVLVAARLATERDLEENHYLEEIGEEIWTTVVEISHCPYCGTHFGEIQGGQAQIAHFNYSDWSSRRS